MVGKEEHRRVPRLSGHPHGGAARAVEPLVELPVVDLIGQGEYFQLLPGLLPFPQPVEGENPEGAGEGPAAAVVVLPGEILLVAQHVGAPVGIARFDGGPDDAQGIGAVGAPFDHGRNDPFAVGGVGQAGEEGEGVGEEIGLQPPGGEIDEAQEEGGGGHPLADVIRHPPHPLGRRERLGEGVEELAGALAGLSGPGESVELLDPEPEGVGVEDKAGAGHDVGPVAGFVLLQQPPGGVLLAGKPAEAPFDLRRELCAEIAPRHPFVEAVKGDEPPEGGVDAAGVPEIDLPRIGADEVGDLSVGRLPPSEGQQPGAGAGDQIGLLRGGHAEGADGGVAAEDGVVVAGAGRLGPAGRQDAGRRRIAAQKGQGLEVAGVDERPVQGGRAKCLIHERFSPSRFAA